MAEKKLEDLLYEYAQKRRKAEQDLDNRKKQLYEKYPRLEEIEDAINRLSIEKAKSILNGNAEINEFDIRLLDRVYGIKTTKLNDVYYNFTLKSLSKSYLALPAYI